MSMLRNLLSVLLLVVFLQLASFAAELKPVKYVFLFIGDGMSIPQRMMAEEFLKKTENRGLKINSMPQHAVTTTISSNEFITDSAASGTAIACGEKTNNGMIGVSPSGERYESVAEVAHKNGKKVGIISSVTINDATPAAFYGHRLNRGQSYDLGLDLVASGFEYFGGGGVSEHKPKSKETKKEDGTVVKEEPEKDIYDLAKDAGYTVCRKPEEVKTLQKGVGKVIALGSETDFPYAIDQPAGGLRLADFTRQAIELLDNPKGFFIMTEGGKIDWMCHGNDAATTLWEIVEFDNAVKVAFEFAEKHPDETLIVVTGDHETGGLTLGFAGTGYQTFIELIKHQKASTDALETDIRAYVKEHPDAEFNDLRPYITEKTGLLFTEDGVWKPGTMILTKGEIKELEASFDKFFKKKDDADNGGTKLTSVARTLVRLVNNKAGLAWTTGGHTALPVNTTAWGKCSDAFFGMIDNTDIAKKLKPIVAGKNTRTLRQPNRFRQ
ncbi:alkaline phosphatase [Planctomycetales bacterium]|nr:alkaline phosphatase [Planctomycetales bacterium]